MPKHTTDLTAKQSKFVTEFLVDGNGTRAAVAAGYGVAGARVAAHRLLTKVAIRAKISAHQSQDAKRLNMDRQDVIKGLLEAFEMAKAQGNPAAMVSASREVGRLMGYYAPERHAVEVVTEASMATRERLERMTDAELMAMIEE